MNDSVASRDSRETPSTKTSHPIGVALRTTLLCALVACATALWIEIRMHAAGQTKGEGTAPHALPFQGRLITPTGQMVAEGSYRAVFSLYAVPTGGTAVWESGELTLHVKRGGIFNIILGSQAAPLSSIDFSLQWYLGIRIDDPGNAVLLADEPEMLPRISIIPGLYSHRTGLVANAEKLNGHDWGAILVDGSLDPTTALIRADKIQKEVLFGQPLVSSLTVIDGALTEEDLSFDPATQTELQQLRDYVDNRLGTLKPSNSGNLVFSLVGLAPVGANSSLRGFYTGPDLRATADELQRAYWGISTGLSYREFMRTKWVKAPGVNRAKVFAEAWGNSRNGHAYVHITFDPSGINSQLELKCGTLEPAWAEGTVNLSGLVDGTTYEILISCTTTAHDGSPVYISQLLIFGEEESPTGR